MANKRQRPSGTWEYAIKRAKLLPKPLSLTFDTEEEGDAYVARLQQLLDAGIVPEDGRWQTYRSESAHRVGVPGRAFGKCEWCRRA